MIDFETALQDIQASGIEEISITQHRRNSEPSFSSIDMVACLNLSQAPKIRLRFRFHPPVTGTFQRIPDAPESSHSNYWKSVPPSGAVLKWKGRQGDNLVETLGFILEDLYEEARKEGEDAKKGPESGPSTRGDSPQEKLGHLSNSQGKAPGQLIQRIKFGQEKNVVKIMNRPLEPIFQKLIKQEEIQSQWLLILEEGAREDIFDHIGFGQTTRSNMVEQGGIFLGSIHADPISNVKYALIRKAIPGVNAKGSFTSLNMDQQVWKHMLDLVDQIDLQEDLQIVGWYHTHPNSLDVFMSETDMNTQQDFFSQTWHSSLVINPHRELIGGYQGADASACPVILESNDGCHLDLFGEEGRQVGSTRVDPPTITSPPSPEKKSMPSNSESLSLKTPPKRLFQWVSMGLLIISLCINCIQFFWNPPYERAKAFHLPDPRFGDLVLQKATPVLKKEGWKIVKSPMENQESDCLTHDDLK